MRRLKLKHLDNNNLFYNNQFGFTQARCFENFLPKWINLNQLCERHSKRSGSTIIRFHMYVTATLQFPVSTFFQEAPKSRIAKTRINHAKGLLSPKSVVTSIDKDRSEDTKFSPNRRNLASCFKPQASIKPFKSATASNRRQRSETSAKSITG